MSRPHSPISPPKVAAVTSSSLTFIPQNWIVSQPVGIAPNATGGSTGSAYRITLTANSSDAVYQNIGVHQLIYRLPSQRVFEDGFD
jgi:hypothetical protein